MSPMPSPGNSEDEPTFIDRCMGDDMMNQEYDDPAQRRAVCQKQWDQHMKDKEDGAILRYPHVVSAVLNTPWAVLPSSLAVILDLIAFRAQGGRLTAEEIQARIGAAAKPQPRQAGAIAVLPLFGIISHRAGMMNEMSGGISVERFTQAFRQAMQEPAVGAVVIDIDSPGGAVSGVGELADEIYAARGQKPVAAIASSMAASAAYWIGAAAGEFSAIPSAEVGSIGVLAAHENLSKAMEQAGIQTSIISAGKYKAEITPYSALTDEARAHIQERVNDYYDAFIRSVAQNRGVSLKAVREGFGQGRMVGAQKALAEGMIDRVETMDQLLDRMSQRMQGQRPATRAEGNPLPLAVSREAAELAAAQELTRAQVAEVPTVPEEMIGDDQADTFGAEEARRREVLTGLDLRRRRLRLAGRR